MQGDEPLMCPGADPRGGAARGAIRMHRSRPRATRSRSCGGIQPQRRQGCPRRRRVTRFISAARRFRLHATHSRKAQGAAERPAALRHSAFTRTASAFCEHIARLTPAPIEQFEALEQLRALGTAIASCRGTGTHAGAGVDTPEDLERVRARSRAGASVPRRRPPAHCGWNRRAARLQSHRHAPAPMQTRTAPPSVARGERIMRLILLGGPGAGKGTQATIITESTRSRRSPPATCCVRRSRPARRSAWRRRRSWMRRPGLRRHHHRPGEGAPARRPTARTASCSTAFRAPFRRPRR